MKKNLPRTILCRLWIFGITLYLSTSLIPLHAQISGSVFRDFDGDGTRSASVPTITGARSGTAPVENGVGGIIVRAYVEQSTAPVTTTTNANGAYDFPASSIPANSRVRLEFANWQRGYYPAPHNPQNEGTTVQFVRAPASGVNMGINYPSDYCQPTNIKLIVPCFVNGDPLKTSDENGPIPIASQAGTADALVAFNYDAFTVKGEGNSSANAGQFPPDHLGTAGQIGSVWGLALQRQTKQIFSVAVVKRHAGFGPLGTGGIYRTDLTSASPNASYPFLSFPDDLGIPTGDDPHSGLPGNKLFPSADAGPMTAMGRVGFGGADMSEDDQTLYVVNLFDRKVYGLTVGIPAQKPNPATGVKSWAINSPGCPQGEFRPWALKVYRGKIYVGGVCSGEYAPTDASSYANAVSSSLLSGHVYELDPTVPNAQFQSVLSFPLSFKRGSADLTGNCINFDYWQPWTDQFPAPCHVNFVMWPQPMLTDIEFDTDGHMIVGMLDRFGHLAGVANHDPNGNGYYDGFTGGDLLRAAPSTGNQFALESNGTVGGLTSSNGIGNGQGPGGGEFYSDDAWFFNGKSAHDEINNGALALIPGKNEVVSSAYDPITDIYKSGGWKAHNNFSGQAGRGFVVIINEPGTFGKASGLGDMKPLCDPAPVEIGNRIWYDDNRNGIQDAYEPGIDGLTITLYEGNTPVASTTSTSNGQWYFNNSNVPGGLKFNHTYQVRMDLSQLDLYDLTATREGFRSEKAPKTGARLATVDRVYYLSPFQVGSGTDSGIRDSDAKLVNGNAIIDVVTGGPGQNDQNYDFSVHSCPVIEAPTTQLSVCQGETISTIEVDASFLSLSDKVKFVYFDTQQTNPTTIYSSTNVLGTITPNSSSTAANGSVLVRLDNPALSTNSNVTTTTFKYVYAIVEGVSPMIPPCMPFAEVVVVIRPKPRLTAAGGKITCTQTSATLTAALTNEQNQPVANGIYRWTGPNSFSSNVQNPVVSVAGSYTLSAASPDCPNAFTTATAVVEDDKEPPVIVDAYGGALPCPTCTVTISATVTPEASTILWSGPGSFTSNQATVDVSEPGFYVLTVTGPNGCTAQTDVEVQLDTNSEPCPTPAATGGTLTCASTSITLTGSLVNALNQPVANGTYFWTGPTSFTSSAQNPVVTVAGTYTLSASSSICPNAFTTVTALVQSDKQPPVIVDAYGGIIECSTCTVTISATVTPETSTIHWKGPNSFTSNQATVDVAEPGFYTFIATAPNGCTAETEVEVQINTNEDPCPIIAGGQSVTVCSGDAVPPLSVTVINTGAVSVTAVAYVYSPVPLADPYTGAGISLSAVVPVSDIATLTNFVNGTTVSTVNSSSSAITWYVYAIIAPTPADPTCRRFAEFSVTIPGTVCIPISAQRILLTPR